MCKIRKTEMKEQRRQWEMTKKKERSNGNKINDKKNERTIEEGNDEWRNMKEK